MTSAPAFNVVRGVMVLEEPTGKSPSDWAARIAGVSARCTPDVCPECKHDNGCHGLAGKVLCSRWRPFGPRTSTERFEKRVADLVGRIPENIDRLDATLKEALS